MFTFSLAINEGAGKRIVSNPLEPVAEKQLKDAWTFRLQQQSLQRRTGQLNLSAFKNLFLVSFDINFLQHGTESFKGVIQPHDGHLNRGPFIIFCHHLIHSVPIGGEFKNTPLLSHRT